MKQLFILLLLTLNSTIIMNAQQAIQLPVHHTQDNSYNSNSYISKNSDVLLLDNVSEPELEVFLADATNNTKKAMIIAPGGGMFFHAIDHEGRAVAQKLAANGINAFVLKYRLYPVDGNSEAYINKLSQEEDWDAIIHKAKETLPYALEDAIEAIKHIRNNSTQYAIDPSQVGMMGFSAGGALILETSFHAEKEFKPNFIAPIYPWIEIISNYNIPKSPIPAFFDCASNDELGIAPQTVDLYKEWIVADQKAELHMHEDGGHGYGMKDLEAINSWSDLLIDWILRL